VPSKQWSVVWTDYMRYRAELRGFDLSRIEEIVRYTSERYFDTATGRHVAIGRHDKTLVVVPYCRIKPDCGFCVFVVALETDPPVDLSLPLLRRRTGVAVAAPFPPFR